MMTAAMLKTEDIADIMSCYTLTGLPRRHNGRCSGPSEELMIVSLL
jgi:hypothetical protein